MMTFIFPISNLTQSDIHTAGGKGANLGELTRIGLPVPPGFVVSTAAYDRFIETNHLQKQITTMTESIIETLFLDADIPTDMATVLVQAWRDLGAGPVAVRSSATAEDLPEASFAGQQDTYLNVQNETALLDAVKRCWASLWTKRAIAYRQRQKISPDSVSMAVVVQQMVDADASGILFTADPVSGDRDRIVINAAWGLGEAIVGGLVTPDTVLVEKARWQVAARETAVKTTMTVRTKNGTIEQPVPKEKQSKAVLDQETAVALAKLGAKIEAHYNTPMDVEWAVADGNLFILQARPVTSLPPAPLKDVAWEPNPPNSVWMRRQIVEHMPKPLSPLFEDLYLKQGLAQSIEKLLAEMGQATEVDFDLGDMLPQGFANTINGYAYTTGSFSMSAKNLVAILKIYSRIFRFFDMEIFDWEGNALPNYQSLIKRWAALDLDAASDETLLDGIRQLAAADSAYWFGSALNLGLSRILDPVFDRFLKSPLVGSALPPPLRASAAFLRGFDSKALDAQAEMELVASQIRASASLHKLVEASGADRLLDVLAQHPDGKDVLTGIERYLGQYGHQIYNLDFVDPTQNEDPTPLLLSLKALVKAPPEQGVRERQAKMAQERDALVAQTEHALNPLARQLFRCLWRWTKQYAPYREHVMFYMGAAWPTVRKLARELGQRLTDAGTLQSPEDIYYLSSDEIETAVAARARSGSVPAFIQLAQERRTLRTARQQLTPPPKVPLGSTLKFGPLDLSMFDPTPEEADSVGPVLHGYAVSTGRVTAPASVIRSVEQFDQMQPGSVLVCTTTTPAWTPLFSQAVGLVTDVGGALAHGSIVAREYGIPAVMGTGTATQRIQSGMMLSVDGDRGTVTLVDEVGEVAVDVVEQSGGNGRKKALIALSISAALGLLWWRRRKSQLP